MKPPAHTCYLLLGSNLGNRKETVLSAIRQIDSRMGRVLKQSALYVSEPWGFHSRDEFINVVIKVQTYLEPYELLENIQKIEAEAGRIRNLEEPGYKSRTLDIDILFYDDLIMNEEYLTIPHPRLHQRRFTMEPLHEIAPGLVHPLFKKTVAKLLEECTDTLYAKKNEEK